MCLALGVRVFVGAFVFGFRAFRLVRILARISDHTTVPSFLPENKPEMAGEQLPIFTPQRGKLARNPRNKNPYSPAHCQRAGLKQKRPDRDLGLLSGSCRRFRRRDPPLRL